jgi:hypothetical protein
MTEMITIFKKLLLLSIVLLTVYLSFSEALIVSDYDVDLEVVQKRTYNFTLDIYHDNATYINKTIYNVTIEGLEYFNFDPIEQLHFNETKQLHYTVRTNLTFNNIYVGKLKFFTLSNHTKEKSNLSIQVRSDGFSEIDITSYLYDTMQIKNTDTVNHTISFLGIQGFHNIGVNETYSYEFTEIKNITVVDENTNKGMDIEIKSNLMEIPTRNPNLYQSVTFRLKSIYEGTGLEVIMTAPTKELRYNEETTGVLLLRPQLPIYNLNFTSDDWIKFDRNNINITGDNIVVFTVKPTGINHTDDTGKNYTKTIQLTADNIESQQLSFEIYIKQENLTTIIEGGQIVRYVDRPMTPAETEEYCDQDNRWEELEVCQRYLKNQTVEIQVPRVINPDIDEKTLIDFFEKDTREEADTNTIKSTVETFKNELTDELLNVKSTQENNSNMIGLLAEKVDRLYEIKIAERRGQNTVTFGLIILFLIVSSVIGLGVLGIIKRKKMLKRLKGA